MTQVSVVTGTYNRLELLQRMVASARQSAGDLDVEIVVVDGGSDDGTLDWCKSQDDIVLIEHGRLLGAIQAYNDGYNAAAGDYVVTGNDDISFDGDTIRKAYKHLEDNPAVGMVAFAHHYKRRDNPRQGRIQGAMGYPYGQCNMVRRWLGDCAGWWGDEGMRTYGGDTRLSLRLWEMGWPVTGLPGCSVTDYEHDDVLREINSDSPWKRANERGEPHPDLMQFQRAWTGRMPKRDEWISAPANRVLEKAARGNLRTIRFKGMMRANDKPRTALIDALAAYGPTEQVNQNAIFQAKGIDGFQKTGAEIIQAFQPDLVILQGQRRNNFLPETVLKLRQQWPWVYWINWDGDTHPGKLMEDFHWDIARAVNLQCVVSPTLFGAYAARGVGVAYWPIGIEEDYIIPRADVIDGPDVVFLGALYGEGVFPEAETRRDAVVALAKSGFKFKLCGGGWNKVGLEAEYTGEAHADNARLYARSKMALSVSQDSRLWGYTSDRLYNICATGCPALVQRFDGMEQHGYVDGDTCIAWSTIEEMLEKTHHYIVPQNASERERIGAKGRTMTLERHTWEKRVLALFEIIGGLNG